MGFGGCREGGENSRGGAIIRGLCYCEAFAGVDSGFFITFSNVYEEQRGDLVTSAWDSAYSGNIGGVGVTVSTILSLETGKNSCTRGDQGAEVSRTLVHWFLSMMRGDMHASLDNVENFLSIVGRQMDVLVSLKLVIKLAIPSWSCKFCVPLLTCCLSHDRYTAEQSTVALGNFSSAPVANFLVPTAIQII